jgi:NADH:ubiquinone oxidoreductase subunit C
MNDLEIIEKTKSLLGDKILEIANPAVRRIFIKVEPENLGPVVRGLRKNLNFTYLATVTGVDMGESFEILYHFGHNNGSLTVRTQIPRTNPHIESICSIIPGAILYERELQDMFGIIVDHLPDPRQLVLPDGWPAGNFPLRKDWKFERPEEIIPGGKK